MSQRYLVMPRGINVGTRNRVPMAELRVKLTEAGFFDVATVLQSGNVILTSSDESPGRVEAAVERLLAAEFGVDVRCVTRSAATVRALLGDDPLAGIATDPSRHLVYFFSDEPAKAAVRGLVQGDHSPEVLDIRGTEAHVWTPEGVKAMKLSNPYLEKRLGVVATARNWNTIKKIVAKL